MYATSLFGIIPICDWMFSCIRLQTRCLPRCLPSDHHTSSHSLPSSSWNAERIDTVKGLLTSGAPKIIGCCHVFFELRAVLYSRLVVGIQSIVHRVCCSVLLADQRRLLGPEAFTRSAPVGRRPTQDTECADTVANCVPSRSLSAYGRVAL